MEVKTLQLDDEIECWNDCDSMVIENVPDIDRIINTSCPCPVNASNQLIVQNANLSIGGMTNDKERSEAVIDENESNQSKKKLGMYPWFVLAMLFFMRIAMNWQRKSLSYIYGFQGSGLFKGDPMFEIT